MNSMTPSRQAGVTLIELLVTIVIVAILASIALPTYQAQVRKSKRTAAEAFLMDVATRQHQWLLDVRAYAPSLVALGMTTPADIANQYDVNVNAPAVAPGTPPTFIVTATPKGAQLSDSCGAVSINQANAKLAGGVAKPECW